MEIIRQTTVRFMNIDTVTRRETKKGILRTEYIEAPIRKKEEISQRAKDSVGGEADKKSESNKHLESDESSLLDEKFKLQPEDKLNQRSFINLGAALHSPSLVSFIFGR